MSYLNLIVPELKHGHGHIVQSTAVALGSTAVELYCIDLMTVSLVFTAISLDFRFMFTAISLAGACEPDFFFGIRQGHCSESELFLHSILGSSP